MSYLHQLRQKAQQAIDMYTAVIAEESIYIKDSGDGRNVKVFTDQIVNLKNKMFYLLATGEEPTVATDATSWRYVTQLGVKDDNNEIIRLAAYSTRSAESRITNLRARRMDLIIWLAFIKQFRLEDLPAISGVSAGHGYMDMDGFGYRLSENYDAPSNMDELVSDNYYKFLRALVDLKISTTSYVEAIREYNTLVRELEAQINHKTKDAESGIVKLFESRPEKVAKQEWREKQEEAIALFKQMKNGLTARTWGFEIEVPDAKGVNAPYGIEKGDDGSLRSDNHEGCDCDCNDCLYHECDCDICEYGNSDPEHCGDSSYCARADSAEFRTTGGIQRTIHSGMLELCENLNYEDAEINDSAGTHIHVYAHDLTTHEVGQVMASYYWLTPSVMSPIAGRYGTGYAQDLYVNDIANALKRRNPKLRADKPRAVNISHITSISGRGTIEFRQQNCNLNAELIHVWAWLVRGLVEVVKRGAKFTDFREAKTLQSVVAIYEKYNFKLDSENPGIVIVGSKADAAKVIRQKHLIG